MHWLAEYAQKSVKYRITKFGRLSGTDPGDGVKIISNLHFLTWSRVLRKNKGGPLNRVKLRGCLILHSGCTGWQSRHQNLFHINLPNLVG